MSANVLHRAILEKMHDQPGITWTAEGLRQAITNVSIAEVESAIKALLEVGAIEIAFHNPEKYRLPLKERQKIFGAAQASDFRANYHRQ